MANLRHKIVIRTDLGFNNGLMAAQVAHIHFEQFRTILLGYARGVKSKSLGKIPMLDKQETQWLESPYLICHGVPNKEALEFFWKKAKDAKLKVTAWYDTVEVLLHEGRKEALENVFVGFAIGPDDDDKIRAVLQKLPLLGVG